MPANLNELKQHSKHNTVLRVRKSHRRDDFKLLLRVVLEATESQGVTFKGNNQNYGYNKYPVTSNGIYKRNSPAAIFTLMLLVHYPDNI